MREELCFVQFIHPGGEHLPEEGQTRIPWNASQTPGRAPPNHKRKFLLSQGRHVRSPDQAKPEQAEIVFWGEWEAESETIDDYGRGPGPRSLQSPYYVVPDSYEGCQNTDPFVFGETFFYTGCQQRPDLRRSQLCHLALGSVILFGSPLRKERKFLLDTVLVVSDGPHPHRSLRDLSRLGLRGTPYWDVTARPWYESAPRGGSCVGTGHFSLYRGAMFGERADGMFSFFPCMPHDEQFRGIDRPAIDIDLVSPGKLQGVRLNRGICRDAVVEGWRAVAEQVMRAGLCLGVYAEVPEKRTAQ
ncbi:MAG: hypothetical protein ACNA8S_17310 [Deferrisomatales bacterium]